MFIPHQHLCTLKTSKTQTYIFIFWGGGYPWWCGGVHLIRVHGLKFHLRDRAQQTTAIAAIKKEAEKAKLEAQRICWKSRGSNVPRAACLAVSIDEILRQTGADFDTDEEMFGRADDDGSD